MSSQGAASPPLPNGCGRELNGPSLYREKRKMSDVRRTTGGIHRHQPHATMRGVHPRSPKGPGAFANFRRSVATYSRKTRIHRQSHTQYHSERPEERQSARPTRVPTMHNICETELEEVSGDERNQCRTRRQVLIQSPLQNQRGRIGKRLWKLGRFDIELSRQTNTSINQTVPASGL